MSAAHVIVVGNEKGGSGKSTTSMHVIVALLRLGLRVGSVDLDVRQRTLSRYFENRARHAARLGALPMPDHRAPPPEQNDEDGLAALMAELGAGNDVILVDTPGNDSPLTRFGHSLADTLITPMNDSFIDLDVLARVDPDTMTVAGFSQYADMVFEEKKRRIMRTGQPFDWIVMRNRLSQLDARNKQEVERLLAEVRHRLRFRSVPGFSERVIFRELFLQGLTMMDAHETGGGLTRSHLAARQEVRNLIQAINLPALANAGAAH